MSVKESKEDRFRRIAEARTNKLIAMIRLLGNCSNPMVYAFDMNQVEQIFSTLQTELEKAKKRFQYPRAGKRKRFSLSDELEAKVVSEPSVQIQLPDGTFLRAVAYQQDDYPSINVYWDSSREESPELVCFAEYNLEHGPCHELCIGTYQSDKEDTTYYQSYIPEGDEQQCSE